MEPLTSQEKAYFDTLKLVARGTRPKDLVLQRMTLDGKDVAVIMQRVISAETAKTFGWQPLAILCSDEMATNLRDADGSAAEMFAPDGLEGAS